MLFPDQWRGDWIGGYADMPLRTPNIDRLVERGVGFRKAWTPSPLCAPARSCLAFDTAYDRAPVRNNTMDNPIDGTTFYKALRDAGYQVANIGKSDLLKGGDTWGTDGRHVVDGVDRMAALGFSHGFDSSGKHAAEKAAAGTCNEPYARYLSDQGLAETFVADYSSRKVAVASRPPLCEWLSERQSDPPAAYANTTPTPLPDEAYNDNYVGRSALSQINAFERDSPWFMIVNFPGPHEPMDVTERMARDWADTDLPLPALRSNGDDEARQLEIRRRYAAMLENIDGWLGRYLETLDAAGELENTVVVFASDHGEMLGDRNVWKKQVPFEPSVHVPMVLAGPGIQARGWVDEGPANLLDLPATFIRFAEVEAPASWEGFDLLPYLQGISSYPRTTSVSGLGPWRAITDGRHKLVVGMDDTIFQEDLQYQAFDSACLANGELFDLANDPHEQQNLWAKCPAIRDALLAQLEASLAEV